MTFNFILSSSGISFPFQSNNCQEIIKSIQEKMKCNQFILINEKGIKIGTNNLKKEIFSEENKLQNILVLPKIKFSSSNPSNEEINKNLENQFLAKQICDNYNKKKLDQMNKKMNFFQQSIEDYNNYISIIEISYFSYFEEFKKLFSNLEDEKITNQIINIEKKTNDFKNHFPIFKSKFEKIQNSYFRIKNIFKKDINEEKILYSQDSIIPYPYSQLIEDYQNNKLVLDKLIDNIINSNNDFFNQINELSLLQKNLNENYQISNITINFTKKKEEIKEEIFKRKGFSTIYKFMIKYLNDVLIKNEEKRRKEFMNNIINNGSSIYHNYDIFFKDLMNKDIYSDNLNEEKIDKVIYQIKENLNYLNKIMYSDKKNENENKINNNLTFIEIKNELLNVLTDNLKVNIDDNNSMENILNILNEKTKCFNLNDSINTTFSFVYKKKSSDDLIRTNTYNSLYQKNENDNDNFVDNNINQNIENVVNKYEDIIFFYKSLFKFVQQYCERVNKKELKNLEPSKPNSLAQIIENTFKQNLFLIVKLKELNSKFIK
jgi:hypothetical protein